MKSAKQFLDKLLGREKRKADRNAAPELAAFYWTGAAPEEHAIRDISSTGLYLVTEERWYPGTLIMMTLQRKHDTEGASDRSVAVQSKAVRWGTDGVGLQFILPEGKDSRHNSNEAREGVDRKSLEKFLEGFNANNGSAIVNQVEEPDRPLTEVEKSKF